MRSPTEEEKATKIKDCPNCNKRMELQWVGSTGWYHYKCPELDFEKSYFMHGRPPIYTSKPFPPISS